MTFASSTDKDQVWTESKSGQFQIKPKITVLLNFQLIEQLAHLLLRPLKSMHLFCSIKAMIVGTHANFLLRAKI